MEKEAMVMTILSVDIGTTGMKIGVFSAADGDLSPVAQFSGEYTVNVYNDGLFADIEQEKWRDKFIEGCRSLGEHLADIDVIALSGTTPGFTVMGRGGEALYPAILMLDQRSRIQARRIIEVIGLDYLLAETGNMPVAGGCSLASMLWLKDNHPDLYDKAECFGHTNTYMAKWLTGSYAIDPSSASLMALYNTVRNDYTWNERIAGEFDLGLDRLPRIIPTGESAGRLRQSLARELGMWKEPPVIIGGNDAVLAAYSLGRDDPGDIINVNGTCEITLVCLPKCLSSCNYNVRCHVSPDRWLTLYVMNAGGKALEWFRSIFCSEMDHDTFYGDFIEHALDTWVPRESTVTYVPFLMGSRYSLDPLKAEFTGLTQETTREELLAAMVRGLSAYQGEHLREIALEVPLKKSICVTGGAATPAIIRAKKKWMRDGEYVYEDQSSMRGAAMLGREYLKSH